MLTTSLFEAFTGLATLLAFVVVVGALLSLPDSPKVISRGDFTLRPRRRPLQAGEQRRKNLDPVP